nr:MAG TPA: minor tail protein [Caudoviricetes sp.]
MAQILLNVELNSASAQDSITKLKTAISKLQEPLANLQKTDINSRLTAQLNVLAKSFDAASKGSTNLVNGVKKLKTPLTNLQKIEINGKLASQLNALANAFNATGEKANNAAKNIRAVTKAVDENQQAVSKNKSSLLDNAAAFLKWQVVATLVMKPLNAIRDAISSIDEVLIETENRVIEIKRVLNEDILDDRISKKLYELAQNFGQTFENAADIATNFARSGMTWSDSVKATEAALLALNVAELDAEEASNGLIAIMTQFGKGADELTYIIDILNKTADNAPVSTQKLLLALEKVGSYANQAKMSLEETVAVITALSGATGASGQQLGTAVKSLLAYTTKDSSLNVFASLSADMQNIVSEYKKGAASILSVWQQLSKEINSLSAEQADKLAEYFESTDGKSMEEALGEELSEIYDSMTGVYDTAGTYRKNYFIALMKNFEDVQTALDNMNDAEGYSLKENEQYMDTYTAKLNTFKAKWQELANDEQGFLAFKKTLLDIGNGLLALIKYTGGLSSVIGKLGGLLLVTFSGKISTGLSNLVSGFKALKTGMDAATASAAALQAAISWIGVAIMAVSQVIGLINAYKQAQHEARLEAIEAWDAISDNTQELKALATQYEKLTPQTDEYYEVEQKLVKLLSKDKKDALKDLKEGTEEYSKALKNLTEQELANAELKATLAMRAAKKEVEKSKDVRKILRTDGAFWDDDVSKKYFNLYDADSLKLFNVLKELGILSRITYDTREIHGVKMNSASGVMTGGFEEGKDAATLYRNYQKLEQNIQTLYSRYKQAILDGDAELAESLLDYIDRLQQAQDKVSEVMGTYKDTKDSVDDIKEAQANLNKEIDNAEDPAKKLKEQYNQIKDALQGLIDKQKEANQFENYRKSVLDAEANLLEAQRAAEEAIAAKKEAIAAREEELLQAQKDAEEAIAEKREAIAEKEKNLEEKKLDLIKAQKELADTINERNVRVFNEQSGLWEWQANEKNVQKARENVEKAQKDILKAEKDIEDAIKALHKQEEKNAQNIAKAQKNLQKAIEALAEQERKNAENIAKAMEKLAEVQKKIGDELLQKAIAEIKGMLDAGKPMKDIYDKINEWMAYYNNVMGTSGIPPFVIEILDAIARIQGLGNTYADYTKNTISSGAASWGDIAGAFWEKYGDRVEAGDPDAVEANNRLNRINGSERTFIPFSDMNGTYNGESYIYDTIGGLYYKRSDVRFNGDGTYTVPVGAEALGFEESLEVKKGYGGGRNGGNQMGNANNRVNQLYDSGGVLHGLGGIKATERDEMVLPPEITEKILNPQNTVAFKDFCSNLGILYGALEHTMPIRGNVITQNHTANDNRNMSRNTYINGVPISSEKADRYTISELLREMPLVREW